MFADPTPSTSFALDIAEPSPSLAGWTAKPRLHLQISQVAVVFSPIVFAVQAYVALHDGRAAPASLIDEALATAAVILVALAVLARSGRVTFEENGVAHRPYAWFLGPPVFFFPTTRFMVSPIVGASSATSC